MQAVIFDGPGKLRIAEVTAPRIEKPGDALVRVSLSGISGSNVRAYTGEWERAAGTTMGFEFAGEVIEIGGEVANSQPGQRVIGPFSVHCGGCFYCKLGILTACENRQSFGRQLQGSHAEYIRVPRADAVLDHVPDNVTDIQAVLATDSLPGPFGGLQMAGLHAGESVVVLGCGPVGLCAQLLALTMGAGFVVGVDHHDYRLAFARELGSEALNFESDDLTARVHALTGGRGADLVIEAVGRVPALVQAVGLVRPRGRILSLGDGIQGSAEFPMGDLLRNHVTLIPSGVPPVKNYLKTILKMLERGVIDPTPVVTHTLPLAEAARGYELMARRQDGALKVVLKP